MLSETLIVNILIDIKSIAAFNSKLKRHLIHKLE